MDLTRLLDAVRAETTRFGTLAGGGDLGREVAGCPGWTVADLVGHLGGVHRWAARACRGTGDPGDGPAAPDDPAALAGWYADAAAVLIAELETRASGQECWTLADPRTVAFWIRRQAHETVVHRWDLECALGLTATIDPELARDGVEEVVEVLLPRQLRLGRLAPDVGAVELDLGAGGPVRVGPGPAPVASVRTDPETALLLLWRRVRPDDPRLVISGDRNAAARILGAALTP